MEVYYYRCPLCKAIVQVPSYWMGYAHEDTVQQMHFDPETKQPCSQEQLDFESEGDSEG